ncbi:sigma-70 family RNA polymerase sigma factor [Frisingicoccus sp.]|uniref:sigma-70 family RNA polymerase sigma factor n=1 Tax=Frisingicoccus sp. TaxID=1918627 RepID=UPI003AB5CEDD
MEVTEEEYQKYYRPWWQQKKREQRNREAMEEHGYREESYEQWKENDMRSELFSDSLEELTEKKEMLGILQEVLESLMPEEKELVQMVFGENTSVCEYARMKGENRRTLAFRKEKILEKMRDIFRGHGFDI